MIVYGRSDATLNPGGVRMGTAEIYHQVEPMPEIVECLAIGQAWPPGECTDARVVLFVKLQEGLRLDEALTERIRRTNYGNLEIEVTLDDPKAYTQPWTVRLHQLLVPDTELLDYYCNDNEKDSAHAVGK